MEILSLQLVIASFLMYLVFILIPSKAHIALKH